MPQNPFLNNQQVQNPFTQGSQAPSNPFLADATRPFDPTIKPEMNIIGKTVDPVIQAGKTGVMRILDLIGRPQQAVYGAAMNEGIQTPQGRQGFMAGLMGEKHYSGKDILAKDNVLQDSPILQSIAGLGLDLVGDPVNVAGIPKVAKTLATGVDAATNVARKLPGLKQVDRFLDPHADLKDIKGLKEFARLSESEARSIGSKIHEEVADTVRKGGSSKTFVKSHDEDTLRKLSYAIDQGQLGSLSPQELEVAQKTKQLLEDQWLSEVASGHQGAKLGKKGKAAAPKVTDYVPYVTKPDAQRNVGVISNVRGTTKHSKERKFQTLQDAVSMGNADDNLANILQARLRSGRMAQHGSNVVNEAAKRFGHIGPRPGMRKLNTQFVNLPQAVKNNVDNVFFDPKVAEYLERAHTIFNKPDDVKNAYQSAVKVFKSWLVTNPQQVATNLLGNTVNAFLKGNVPTPKNMARAANVVMQKGKPPAIGNYSSDEILTAMQRWEIVGGAGQFQDFVSAGKNYSLNPLKANNVGAKLSQHLNQHVVEEPYKVAQFLQSLEDGADLETAALKVKDTFFDYAEISDAAKFLRDNGIAPFITWQLKNIPLQLETLAKRPQKFAQTESVYDAVTNDETIVPHRDAREGMLPIGDELIRFASPINDLNKLPIGDYEGRDLAVDTLGQMAPWFKAMIELPSNKKLYNAQPIFREGDDAIPMDFISNSLDAVGLDSLVGIGEDELGRKRQNELAAYVLQQNPWQYYGRNLFDPPQELLDKGAMHPQGFMGSVTGFRSKPNDPKKQLNELMRRLQRMEP